MCPVNPRQQRPSNPRWGAREKALRPPRLRCRMRLRIHLPLSARRAKTAHRFRGPSATLDATARRPWRVARRCTCFSLSWLSLPASRRCWCLARAGPLVFVRTSTALLWRAPRPRGLATPTCTRGRSPRMRPASSLPSTSPGSWQGCPARWRRPVRRSTPGCTGGARTPAHHQVRTPVGPSPLNASASTCCTTPPPVEMSCRPAGSWPSGASRTLCEHCRAGDGSAALRPTTAAGCRTAAATPASR
mmetsp:Transcript_153645/g.492496  ORF Transcript_153645/g.492496 Transcript_153645/m.492496 type:complete len:246 (-) Transcript_153645:118-855(-)